jgi:hypothetical protein
MMSTVVTEHPRSTAASIVVGRIRTSAASLAALVTPGAAKGGSQTCILRGHASKTKP